jgi:hypothetical protein
VVLDFVVLFKVFVVLIGAFFPFVYEEGFGCVVLAVVCSLSFMGVI